MGFLRSGNHPKSDFADHSFGLVRYLDRNGQEPASRHREGRHEGVHARFRAGQRNERRGHFGSPIVRHDDARLDDHRVGDGLFAALVHQPHGSGRAIPGDIDMSDIAITPDTSPVPIPVGELLP
jgi:hypothetical protein